MKEAMEQVRDYIALIMTMSILAMVGFHVAIPDRIWDIYMMVIAFFFGSKSTDIPKDTITTTVSETTPKEVKP